MLNIEIEVYCNTCGAHLCNETEVTRINHVNVSACRYCVDAADEKGYDRGYDEGYTQGCSEH